MIHVRRCFTETSSAKFDPLLFVQFVTHSDMERSRHDRHVLRRRMMSPSDGVPASTANANMKAYLFIASSDVL